MNICSASLIDKLKIQTYLSKNLIFHTKNINKGRVVGAQTSWVNILKLQEISGESWCLNYRIPLDNSDKYQGELKLILSNDCDKSFLNNSIYHILKIQDFQIDIIEENKLFKIKLNGSDYSFSKNPFGKILSFNDVHSQELQTLGAKYIADNRDLVICHDFDKNCDESVANNCEQCRYGWFSGAASACTGKRTKYCGVAQCGETNLPACLRGDIYNDVKAMQGCQNGSFSGFCSGDLEIFCENGQLFCR